MTSILLVKLPLFSKLSTGLRKVGFGFWSYPIESEMCSVMPRPALPESIRAEADKRGLVCRVGTMEALGGLVGCGDDDFNLWLRGYIDSLQPYLDMLLHPELPVQITMLLLRLGHSKNWLPD